MEAILHTLKSMWKTEKSFDIRDLGSNMVLILFNEEYNLDHILMRDPWSFDKYLLGLYKLERNKSVKNAQKFLGSDTWPSNSTHKQSECRGYW